MSLVKYEVLLNALEYGSITAAAEKMGYTQSGVSHLINSLEKELGVKLIIRGRNGVRPTPVGESLMPYIRRITSENESFHQALNEITGLVKGKLTIGSFATISSFYLPEVIKGFLELHPNIDFELKSGSYTDIEKWIVNKEVECGFVSLPSQETLTCIPVIMDRLVIATGKNYDHGFANPNSVTLSELEKVDHILIDGKNDYDCIRFFGDSFPRIRVKVITSDAASAIEMVENNLGVIVIPIYLVKDRIDKLNIFEPEKTHNRTLAMAYLNKKEASPVLKKFINYVESQEIKIFNTI